jgi:FkbM family methyltransferase
MAKVGLFKKWGRKLRRKFGKTLDVQTVTFREAHRWYEDRREGYEEMAEYVAPYVPKDGVFFGIGANVGFFTKVLAEKIGFKGKVILFEPVPNLAKICEECFQNAPFETKVHAFGLGDKNETLKIHTDKSGNLGWNTFISEKAGGDMATSEVQVKVFDKTGIKTKPAFVKIDVEGAEYKVLSGMMKSLKAWKPRPVLLCELGWGKKHPHWKEQVKVLKRLMGLGYSLYTLEGKKIGLDEVHEEPVTTDYLFLPKGRKFIKV